MFQDMAVNDNEPLSCDAERITSNISMSHLSLTGRLYHLTGQLGTDIQRVI